HQYAALDGLDQLRRIAVAWIVGTAGIHNTDDGPVQGLVCIAGAFDKSLAQKQREARIAIIGQAFAQPLHGFAAGWPLCFRRHFDTLPFRLLIILLIIEQALASTSVPDPRLARRQRRTPEETKPMLSSKTCRIAFTCLLTGAALLGPVAQAQYPEQAIKLLVPYPPGGATDVIGRVVGQALAERLKTTVVVENKSGASGSIGAADVAKSKPDGYTLLLGALTSHSIYQNLYAKNATYDLNKDFSPVAIVGRVPLGSVTHPS